MYNNFSSKKTKKVISALLASALVVTSAPITADAATAKVVGIGKTFTIKKTTKVSGLSKAEKKIVKVTVNKKKRTVTVKGVKAGKATFKIGKKAYTVMVGATSITKKTVTTNMTAGETKTLSVNAVNGKGDTIQFTSSKKGVVKVNKASAKANAKNVASTTVTAVAAGTAKITAKSKFTGKSKTFTIKVEAAAPAATTAPAGTDAPEATTGTATTAPATSQDPAKTEDPNTTKSPNATDAPETVTGGTITVTTNVTGASVKVISGTAVIAGGTTGTTTGATIDAVENGSYIIEVSKDGYETAKEIVTVNGDTKVDITLAKITSIKVLSATAENDVQGTKVELDGATNVVGDRDRGITVTFDTALDEKSVNVNNFRITKDGVNQPLSSVTLDSKKKSVTITPVNNLKDNTKYVLVVSPEVKAAAAETVLGTEYTATFTTGDLAYALSGSGTTKFSDNGVYTVLKKDGTTLLTGTQVNASQDSVIVKYNKAIDPSSVNTTNVKLYNKTEGKYVGVIASLTAADEITVTFADNLPDSELFELQLTGVKALLGVSAVNDSFSFVTAASALTHSATTSNGSTPLDSATVYPKLVAGTLDGSTTVHLGASFYVTFSGASQAVDETTINSDTVTLVKWDKEKSEAISTVSTKISYDAATKRMVVTPLADLEDGVDYQLKVKDVKDEFGTTIAEGAYVFNTYDVTAPTVTDVEIKSGATDTYKKVNSGVTGIDENKTLYIKVNFSEKMTATEFSNVTAYGAGSTLTGFANGDSVMIVNAASGQNANITIGTITLSTDGKSAIIPVSGLANNTTYTLYLAGKKDMPSGSNNGAVAIKDAGVNNQTRMEETFAFSFSTAVADVTKPTLDGVKYGSSYKDGKDLKDAVGVTTDKIVYAQFSEEINITGYPIGIKEGATDATLGTENVSEVTDGTTGSQSTLTFVDAVTNVHVGSILIKGSDYYIVTGMTDTSHATLNKSVSLGGSDQFQVVSGVVLSKDTVSGKTTMAIDLTKAKNGSPVTKDKKITLTFKKNVIEDKATKPNPFAEDTSYTFLSADGKESVTQVDVTDKTPATKQLPAVDINKDTDIYVLFDEAVNAANIDSTTVAVVDSKNNKVDVEIDPTYASTADSTGGTYGTKYYIKLDPKADLTAGEEYTVTIDGLNDIAGNPIAKYSKSFKVTAATSFTSCSITDGQKDVDVTPVIEVKIANPEVTLTNSNVQLKKASGAVVDTVAKVDGETIKLYPYAPLTSYSEYKVVIDATTGVTGGKTINFTTSATAEVATIESAKYDSTSKTIEIKYNVPIKTAPTGFNATGGVMGNSSASVSSVDPTIVVYTLGTGDSVTPNVTTIGVKGAQDENSKYIVSTGIADSLAGAATDYVNIVVK